MHHGLGPPSNPSIELESHQHNIIHCTIMKHSKAFFVPTIENEMDPNSLRSCTISHTFSGMPGFGSALLLDQPHLVKTLFASRRRNNIKKLNCLDHRINVEIWRFTASTVSQSAHSESCDDCSTNINVFPLAPSTLHIQERQKLSRRIRNVFP